MKLNFHSLALVVTFVSFSLTAVWLFAPQLLLSSWGVEYTPSLGVLGRRLAAPFAGFGVLVFAARNAPPSPVRSALVMAFVTVLLGSAALGFFELVSSRVSTGILPACLIEIALALAFLYVAWADNRKTRKETL